LESSLIDSLIAQHPELLYYEAQGERLEVDRRLQAEQLKPELSLKYQALSGGIEQRQLLSTLDPMSNLKYGFKFSFPLFLRKQRGYLTLSKIAIQENELQTAQKRLEIGNKIGALQSQIAALEVQVQVYADMVKNYQRMVDAEMEKFLLGESSIFLVNSREQKLIESQLKLNQLQSKLPMLIAEANRATGGYLLD
jgi:outer membrane protein TolC